MPLWCPALILADFIDMHRIIGTRFPHHRIIVAIAFSLPAMAGNVLLWKSHRDNKAALLAGLYMVCRHSIVPIVILLGFINEPS